MRSTQWLWAVVIFICVGSVAASVGYALHYDSISSFLWPLPLIAVTPGLVGVGGLALAMKDAPRSRFATVVALACVAVWLVFTLGMFDVDLPVDPGGVLKHIETCLILSLCAFAMWGCFVAPVLRIEVIDRPVRIARRMAVLTGTGLALLWVAYAIGEEFFSFSESGWRIALTVATLLTSAAMLCLPLIYKLQQKRRTGVEESKIKISTLLCPRCSANCIVDGSTATCAQCRLPIQLDRLEPRCACGYLLVNLEGNTCPECGKGFAARIRYEMVSG